MLRFSDCTGGGPEADARFAVAGRASAPIGHISQHLPQQIRCESWKLFVTPVLPYATRGLLRNVDS